MISECASRSAAMVRQACSTVVWSRPPKLLPISGSDSWVSSLASAIAIWRGRATARGVSPRPLDADRVAVSGGLAPGEEVVVEAPATLKDKARVRVRESRGESK